MGSRIVFFLTEDQATVLTALHRKRPIPDDTWRSRSTLRDRGLVTGYYPDAKLTPLGAIAARLASAIAPGRPPGPASRARARAGRRKG